MAKGLPQSQPGQFKDVARRIFRDKIALASAVILVGLYLAIAFADLLAPYGEHWSNRNLAGAPPTPVYTLTEDGALSWPYVFAWEKKFNPETLSYAYLPDLSRKYYIDLFAAGSDYKLFGLFPGNVRLFGVEKPGVISLLGNDINGRDIFSRMLYGGQISLTVGFLALFIVFPVGMIYGGISGYFGGKIDNAMMRVAEIVLSIPSFFLLVSLAAILPPGLSSAKRFALVIVILAFVGWAGLSRVIRGMVLSIKNQEFVESARAIGMGSLPIITRHILPQTASYLLVALTLSVPGYILAESGLSFLGLGIVQPDASWGNMLKEAQDITNVINRPWMLAPGFLIFLAVLAFNVIGDATRDVLDPKTQGRR